MSDLSLSPSPARMVLSPLLYILVSFPIACFFCALLTDLAYLETANMLWSDFSAWLLAVGVGAGVLAAIVGLIALVLGRTERRRGVWPLVLGSVVVLVLAFLDNLVHSRDAWTSVAPTGLALTAVTVLATLATAWLGFAVPARPYPSASYTGRRP